ncbi:hypothetical protein BJ123_108150 [Rhodopseudomonas thermotolerans]|uniref:Uncharacterized protein n=2 Tax=Rhodopseudomonas TaxID=1073 RepID=A0A336JT55_9BRAD|nr:MULTISPECIES: hypothetical protein [Rhodopseudomonas]RED36214.1 hypothetical protein BJ125_108149 [Rhodopseudomonas pentothenatexigens]REG03587.1 hypothetical protein BJ123_108150 [Rhodopseudomonas thermotolerans]SSW90774.1 hypothetical protein SAMN05892882_108149 [Rhodopseudomonas pentothenatexigens]
MHENDTTPSGTDQSSEPNETLQFESLFTNRAAAASRDAARAKEPVALHSHINPAIHTLSLFVSPGLQLSSDQLLWVDLHARCIGDPRCAFHLVDVEISTLPTGCYAAAEGLPEDYHAATLQKLLCMSHSVVIAVTGEDGVEPRLPILPVQLTIRCREDQVAAWLDYVNRRRRANQPVAVIRAPKEGAAG